MTRLLPCSLSVSRAHLKTLAAYLAINPNGGGIIKMPGEILLWEAFIIIDTQTRAGMCSPASMGGCCSTFLRYAGT